MGSPTLGADCIEGRFSANADLFGSHPPVSHREEGCRDERRSGILRRIEEAEQVMTHQPAISFPISFQHPFNRAGGRTSNDSQRNLTIMLDDIRNVAGDLLSGKMKEAEIALTKQESSILSLKIEGLIDQLASLREERITLIKELESQRLQLVDKESLITDMASKLQQNQPVEERLEDPSHEVLKILFKNPDGLDIKTICSHLNVEQGVANYHVGFLLESKFIGITKRVLNYAGASMNFFYINQKGRTYVMKNG